MADLQTTPAIFGNDVSLDIWSHLQVTSYDVIICGVLDSQSRLLDFRSRFLGLRSQVLDSKSQVLDSRFQVLDSRSQVLDSRSRVLDSRFPDRRNDLAIVVVDSYGAPFSMERRLGQKSQGLRAII